MRILVSADAENDLVDGAWFYESLEPGLGDYLVNTPAFTLKCGATSA